MRGTYTLIIQQTDKKAFVNHLQVTLGGKHVASNSEQFHCVVKERNAVLHGTARGDPENNSVLFCLNK